MKAVQKQTPVVDIANDSKSSEVSIEDSGLTVIQKAVRDAFLEKDRTILTKFLSEMKGILDDSELADYVNQQRDKLGNTALHTCCMMYEQELNRISSIFEKTRDIFNNKRDQEDFAGQCNTKAVFAAMTKHSLLEAGLDPNIRNLQGRTAIELLSDMNKSFFLKADSVVIEDMQQSIANTSTTVPPSHVSKLDNEPKRKGGCIIV